MADEPLQKHVEQRCALTAFAWDAVMDVRAGDHPADAEASLVERVVARLDPHAYGNECRDESDENAALVHQAIYSRSQAENERAFRGEFFAALLVTWDGRREMFFRVL